MSVYAIDGSTYTLPASDTIRAAFDPDSGLDNPGKGHYPLCKVSTAYNVFRRTPVACTIAPYAASERDEAPLLLPHIPHDGIILFDRGYPSYALLLMLMTLYAGHFLMRCPATGTFPAVERFVRTNTSDALIWIDPSHTYLHECSPAERVQAHPLRVRAIRLEGPDGTVSVLLTTLCDTVAFPEKDIIDLYFQRYRIEEYYRDEKITLQIETFHSRTPNGIRQELFAAAIMSILARILINLTGQPSEEGRISPQFKNAVMAIAHDAFVLTPHNPLIALALFKELLDQIARVKYYRPKTKRPPQPRVCKKPPNKWCEYRATVLTRHKTVCCDAIVLPSSPAVGTATASVAWQGCHGLSRVFSPHPPCILRIQGRVGREYRAGACGTGRLASCRALRLGQHCGHPGGLAFGRTTASLYALRAQGPCAVL
jgi:hypothetical protein